MPAAPSRARLRRRVPGIALALTALLALGFLGAHVWERTVAPCRVEDGCFDERFLAPMGGFIAALMALAALALGLRARHRSVRAFAAVPCLLAAAPALVVVVGQVDEWLFALWWPLLVVSLADAAILVVPALAGARRSPPDVWTAAALLLAGGLQVAVTIASVWYAPMLGGLVTVWGIPFAAACVILAALVWRGIAWARLLAAGLAGAWVVFTLMQAIPHVMALRAGRYRAIEDAFWLPMGLAAAHVALAGMVLARTRRDLRGA